MLMARFPVSSNRRLWFRLCLAGALSVCAAFPNPRAADGAAQLSRVTIAYSSPGPRVSPLWIAQDRDFFGKYGLAAQVVLVRSNQMLTAGLTAGDIDVGYTGGPTVLGAAAAGVELKMLT